MREVISLNQGWLFGKIPDKDMNCTPQNFKPKEKVDLPHTWYEDGNPYDGTALYRRELDCHPEDDQLVWLEFCGVDKWCKVFLNDVYIGEHKGGYSAFRFPLEREILRDHGNILDVLVDNRSYDVISPLGGDFTIFGGIYRDVNLIYTSKTHFDMMYYGTNGVIVRTGLDKETGDGLLNLEPHVVIDSDGADIPDDVKLFCQVSDESGNPVLDEEVPMQGKVTLHVAHPNLWNGKKDPAMYQICMILVEGDEILDRIKIKAGFRSIAMDPDKGFFLNGEHLRIRGVAKHQDFGDFYSAVGPKQWDRDIELIKEVGANAVRLSHYQHPQYFYDLCDREGLVVWAEIPMLGMPDSEELMENAFSQLRELILQNIHHPSICFWGIQNEIGMMGSPDYMVENCRKLAGLAKELDPDRLTTGASMYTVEPESGLNKVTDMVGYNIYYGWYYGEMREYSDFLDGFHKARPDLPLGISEYGVDCSLGYHQEKPKVKDYSEEFQCLFHETVYPIIESKDYLWGSFIWNMFDFNSARRDEGGSKYYNRKGIVSADRKTPKDAFYYYKARWSDEPFVHIAEKRFEKRSADRMNLKVYSNQHEVTLETEDGNVTKTSENGVFIFEQIPLKKGQNFMRALGGDCVDEAVFLRVDEPEESYNYVDPHPEINVRNWFMNDEEKERLFPAGKCSVNDKVCDLIENDDAMAVIEEWSKSLADMMRDMTTGMALMRYINRMKDQFDDKKVKELNARLSEIPVKKG